jgi:ribosomal protein S1
MTTQLKKQNIDVAVKTVKIGKVQEVPVTGDPNFDWDAFEASCPSVLRKGNPFIKTQNGDKVYCRESYAQQLYDLYDGVTGSMKVTTVQKGEHHTGTIYSVTENTAMIDIGYRELIYINLSAESPQFRKLIMPGKEFMVKITTAKEEGSRGIISGSVTEGTRQAIFAELRKSIDEGKTAYTGTVTQMIPGGGYIVNVQGIDCFMPGSLAGANKLADFESIIGTDLYVVPVSFSTDKGTIVVSHRKYLQAMIPHEIDKLRELPAETMITGNVTGTAKFGVFVEFNGCLTGMIHVNDLNEEMSKLQASGKIEAGSEISFMIKEIISDKKITLTQVVGSAESATANPWTNISERYTVPCQIQGTVKSIKDYGIFVTIEEGIVGLLHISELEGIDINAIKKGDPITVMMTRIDEATRKVFLKL